MCMFVWILVILFIVSFLFPVWMLYSCMIFLLRYLFLTLLPLMSYTGILLAVIIILICMPAPMLNLIWSVPFPISIMHPDVLLLLFSEMWCEACSCLLWLCSLSYWPGSIKKGELCRSCQLGYMEGNQLFRGISFLFSFLRAYYLVCPKNIAITKMEACELQWHEITLLRILLFCNFAINLFASCVLYKLKMVLCNENKL